MFDDPSPVTGEVIKVLDGRWGPYVTDGASNASLPKGSVPEDLSINEALDLLAARAAKGGKKRKAIKKSVKKKKAKKKKAAKKKPLAKKGVRKKKP